MTAELVHLDALHQGLQVHPFLQGLNGVHADADLNNAGLIPPGHADVLEGGPVGSPGLGLLG